MTASSFVTAGGHVTLWPNRSGLPADARPVDGAAGPIRTSAVINGQARTVLRFDGNALLELPRRVPSTGSLFVVFKLADKSGPGQRLLGWEDSDAGKHGLGLMLEPGGRLHAILRNNGQSGDLVDSHPTPGFELVSRHLGFARHDARTATGRRPVPRKGLMPSPLTRQSPPCGWEGRAPAAAPDSEGDLAEIRVYDRQLDEPERRLVEAELRAVWFDHAEPKTAPTDALTELHDEFLSPRGPFWLPAEQRSAMLSAEVRVQAERAQQGTGSPQEEASAGDSPGGGRSRWRSQGHAPRRIQNCPVFLRGNPKRLGKTVPRGVPRIFVGECGPQVRIKSGSGRRELAEWLVSPRNPLTARVMVNRIWQHHFGEGLVRTPNDFGERGERPASPGLLDWLAARFVESGWSVKAMHRLIMLSSAYQAEQPRRRPWRSPRTQTTVCWDE